MTIHLQSLTYRSPRAVSSFPSNVPIIRTLTEVSFESEMTFLVGDNGSGKSTLLEAIAVATRLPTVGSENASTDPSLKPLQDLAKSFRLSWSKKTHRGFFMRSEDFFGFIRRSAQTREELQQELSRVEEEYKGRSTFAKGQARMASAGQLHQMQQRYGDDLDAHSHGESYFTLFQARFVPNGLYLLDEPEAPLSPMRQLSFLSLLKLMIDQDAQFIIATHSPIIMAYPGATILSFDGDSIEQVKYEDLEHVQITRSFLNDPQIFLNHLIGRPRPT